ncbi:hypothetical protein, partial [Vibrio cholerae]|uniref:hypothetical protein n=1 Tax=Vibrio cholerae TaxID=666 RepID=UPI0022718AFE
ESAIFLPIDKFFRNMNVLPLIDVIKSRVTHNILICDSVTYVPNLAACYHSNCQLATLIDKVSKNYGKRR